MSSRETDNIMRAVERDVETVMQQFVDDVAAELRRDLSVPVDRTKSPPTRSRPGQFPRRDKGRLVASVQAVVYRAAGIIRGTVATNTPYDAFVNRTRPFVRLTEEKWRRRAEQRFAFSLRAAK